MRSIANEWLAVLSLFAAGCAPDLKEAEERYGLRAMDLRISRENPGQVLSGGLERGLVAAELRLNGATVPGRAALSGQGSISDLKKSYRFEVSGDAASPIPYRSFKISAQTQDRSMMRTLLGRRVFESLGLHTPEVEPVVLYFNGGFAGLHLLIELITPDFFERRGVRVERIYKSRLVKTDFGQGMVADPESGLEAELGEFNRPEIQRIARFVRLPVDAEGGKFGAAAMDLENAVKYFAAELFLVNCDGFNNNVALFKERDDLRMKFVPWDWDRSNDGSCGGGELLERSQLALRFLDYPGLRALFNATLEELSRTFTPARVREILEEEMGRMERAYLADRYLGILGAGPEREVEGLFGLFARSIPAVKSFVPAR